MHFKTKRERCTDRLGKENTSISTIICPLDPLRVGMRIAPKRKESKEEREKTTKAHLKKATTHPSKRKRMRKERNTKSKRGHVPNNSNNSRSNTTKNKGKQPKSRTMERQKEKGRGEKEKPLNKQNRKS